MADASSSSATTAAAAPAPRRMFILGWPIKRVLRLLRVINMLNGFGVMICAIAMVIVVFANVNEWTITSLTVSTYVFIFGFIMTCIECNIGNLQHSFARNCGWLFSYWGRAIYISFTGSLCLVIGENTGAKLPGYLTGAFTLANAVFNFLVICLHPSFKDGTVLRSNNPYSGYTGAEKEMASYLRSRPDLARRAGSAALRGAAAHPDAARAVAQGAASSSSSNTASAGQQQQAGGDNPWA